MGVEDLKVVKAIDDSPSIQNFFAHSVNKNNLEQWELPNYHKSPSLELSN